MMTIYATRIWGEQIIIYGDFAQASCPIKCVDADGEWHTTQYQVADFHHNAIEAMRDQIMELADPTADSEETEADIQEALDLIEEFDAVDEAIEAGYRIKQ